MSALAFFRNPTSSLGVLCDSSFEPLTLHGTRVGTTIRHGVPIVTVSYEYRNQTASSQKVFAAFAVPSGWRFLSARADASMGNNFIRSMAPTNARAAAPLVSKGVATLQVPWSIMVGQFVVVQATFMAPPTSSSFTIPQNLFPRKVTPVATTAGWRGAFAIQAPSKFKEGCSISMEGMLSFPLDRLPEVNKGTVPVTGTLLGDPKGFRIAFDTPQVDSDLVIRFPFKPSAVSELQMQLATVVEVNRDVVAESEAFAVVTTLNPAYTGSHLREPNAEFIFVFGLGNGISAEDVSQVRDAFHACLAGLPPSCNVNAVCCTGSSADSDIWLVKDQASVPVGDELLQPFGAGTAFLKQIASYAHSETINSQVCRSAMKRPASLVQEIIGTKPFVRGLARNIVLVTSDGGDTQAAVTSQMVVANRHSTSVSAVALEFLGASDIEFLSNIAAVSNGTVVRCQSSNTITESLLELVSVLAVPALTQINVHYTDSHSPSPDGSSAASVIHCGVPVRDIPFIRAGSDPQCLYAFANASVGQLTVKVEGLIGTESMQYVIKTPKEAAASSEQSSCAKGNALSLSPAHLMACALRQDQLIRAGKDKSEEQRLTASFGVPTATSAFAAVDEAGVVADDLVVVAVPNPLTDFALGRKGALPPDQQNNAVTVVSTSGRPFGNVATNKELQARLVQYGELERQVLQRKAQADLDARRRREKAAGIDDQEAADASYAEAQLQIDAIRNPTAEYLGGEANITGGSSGPKTVSTSDYFRSIVEALIGAIVEPLNVGRVLRSQQADGSLRASSALALAALGVTSEVLSHIPAAIANKARADDLWITIIALTRVQNDPRAILFQRKARGFLVLAGVEPDQHEAHAQHVLASS